MFLELARQNMAFILDYVIEGQSVFRSFKERRGSVGGFLDDYAFVIQALIRLYQGTFEERWLDHAQALMAHALENFYDTTDGFFNFTSGQSEKLIARKKEIFDNVIPSSNAIMAQNLFALGVIFDHDGWKEMATRMVEGLSHLIKSEPNYMSQWAIALTEIKKGLKEVLIIGSEAESVRKELQKDFRPFAIWMGTDSKSDLPLFEGKTSDGVETMIYVCEQKVCKLPVSTVAAAKLQL